MMPVQGITGQPAFPFPVAPNATPGAGAPVLAAQAAAQAEMAVRAAEANLVMAKAQSAAVKAANSSGPGGDQTHVPKAKGAHKVKAPHLAADSLTVSSEPDPFEIEGATTIVMKNLPLNYKRNMFLKMLDYEGFAGEYDFVYLPVAYETGAGLGYAFLNLTTPDAVPRFWKTFNGYTKWLFRSAKVCNLSWSNPHQGLAAHVKRYRNSPLMHEAVPDEYRPIVLENGTRVPFPAPTKRLWAPNFTKASKSGRASQLAGA